MSDQLKEFFKEKENQFYNVEDCPSGLWDRIDSELDSNQERSKSKSRFLVAYKYMKVAALFILVFGAGIATSTWMGSQNSGKLDLATLAPELFEAEQFYVTTINEQREMIFSSKEIDEALVKEFLKEHEVLDLVYVELKEMLTKNVDNEKVMQLMIENLQMRLQVLEKQKTILEKIQSIKSGKNGTRTM